MNHKKALTVSELIKQLSTADASARVWVSHDDVDQPSSDVYTVDVDYDREAVLLTAAAYPLPEPESGYRFVYERLRIDVFADVLLCAEAGPINATAKAWAADCVEKALVAWLERTEIGYISDVGASAR